MLNRQFAPTTAQRRGQRGVSLIIALLVLLAMTLAGLAVVRSTFTSTRVSGNLAFQQAATHSSDAGVEDAVRWLLNNRASGGLHQSLVRNDANSVKGYFANVESPNAGESWLAFWDRSLAASGRVNELAADSAGNTVRWVVHRLCTTAGSPTAVGNACQTPPSAENVQTGSKGGGVISVKPAVPVFYRITVRVDGPRNTTAFVQAVVSL